MIDGEQLARQTAGDTDLQIELLSLFLKQLRELLDVLSDGRNQAARLTPGLAGMLHRIRGAAGAVGAASLARSLGHAEDALLQDPSSGAAVEGLRMKVDAACATLARLIAARETAGLAKGGESR